MPSIGFGEIIVILLVALIVFGPRKLPEIGRTIGKSLREFRRAASSLKSDFEGGLDDDEPPSVASESERKQGEAPEGTAAGHSPPSPDGPAPGTDPGDG